MRTVVSFVMTKLSSKGIFQNTLSFAGRMLGESPVPFLPFLLLRLFADDLIPLFDSRQPLPSSESTESPSSFSRLSQCRGFRSRGSRRKSTSRRLLREFYDAFSRSCCVASVFRF